jgi:branched-chain amino acid aminotransferase
MSIWIGGRLVPEAEAWAPLADRTFEHGLGLFETLRTWNGRPKLLGRHLARMIRSADALGLAIDVGSMPDEAAVGRLLAANRVDGDAVLRITLSGGRSDREFGMLWMRQAPLPPPVREGGAIVVPAVGSVAYDDPLARHKTLNYWSKRRAYERGRAGGADEVLLATPDGRVWEGSRTNLFLIEGDRLITPDLGGPVLPGLMRALVLEKAAEVGLDRRENSVTTEMLDRADEVFLTNAVRGILPVGSIASRTIAAPGPWTRKIRSRVEEWLRDGE